MYSLSYRLMLTKETGTLSFLSNNFGNLSYRKANMPQSLSKVYVHLVFSTKNHQPFIDAHIKDRLFDFLGGICREHECNPIRVGGHSDHVHILCLLSRKISLAKLLEEVKKISSLWIKTVDYRYAKFYWQDGYGAFSVNPKGVEIVTKYITNQEKHHTRVTFKDEFRGFLKRYQIEYDERYVWD
jgi:putative transposase